MSKIGRNELCPCGSNKKYKKCCGASFMNEIDVSAANKEMYQAHERLKTFAHGRCNGVIEAQIKQYPHREHLDEIYKIGLTPWIVTHLSLVENDLTVFQAFLQREQQSLGYPVRQQLIQWIDCQPSIYQVVALDEHGESFATLQDIAGRKETFIVPYEDAAYFPEGGLVSGIIIPYFDHHNFLFQMIRLFNDNVLHFKKLILAHNHYPNLLEDVLEDGLFQEVQLEPAHEEVADLFASYAAEKGYTDQDISRGVLFWLDYCKAVNPTVMKPDLHAAALTYLFEKDIVLNKNVRQSDIADTFGASPSTLSATYRKMATTQID